MNTVHITIATLAHELCHFVLFVVFDNYARPYGVNDVAAAAEFEEISKECQTKKVFEDIIALVYDIHECEHQHAELIVRVPHILSHYFANANKINELRLQFKSLFDFYVTKVVPRLEMALDELNKKAEKELRAKDKKILLLIKILVVVIVSLSSVAVLVGIILYEPTFSWSSLSDDQKSKLFDGSVRLEGNEMRFSDLFGINESSSVFGILTSEQIGQLLLSAEPLDLNIVKNKLVRDQIFIWHIKI
jgi:hypothetical protein